MSLPIPLGVRLRTSKADLRITSEVHDLQFRSVVPGGYASAQVSLNRPLAIQPDEIDYYARLTVYYGSQVVWEGRLEDPSRAVSSAGQVWDLTAVGPAAHAKDRTVPLIYIDTDMQRWVPVDVTITPNGTVNITTDPVGSAPAMVMQFPNGTPLVTNSRVVRAYRTLNDTGQKLARYDFYWSAGRTDVNLRVQSVTRAPGAVGRDGQFNSGGGGALPQVITTNFANTSDWLEVRILWSGGSVAVADDVTWAAFLGLMVQATRYNQAGSEMLTGTSYPSNTLLASDVVADLLGRLLTQYDGANASIATTTFPIEQLAYPDGVTSDQVLTDLMGFEPGFFWAAWEANAAGLYRFEWKPWPTVIRYEATAEDGIDSPGSADSLYNAVQVRYRDAAGNIVTARRTATVPALDAAGLTREAFLDQGDNVGSAANAAQAGDKFLAQHQFPPNAGTLTVARPILDRVAGRMVQPWEIKPGELIRVRGILPRIDALNASDRDGVTVFRVAAATFKASTASAAVELDSYPKTTAAALATIPVVGTRRR